MEQQIFYQHFRRARENPLSPLEATTTLGMFYHIISMGQELRVRCEKLAGGRLYHYQRGKSKWEPHTKGGLTVCSIWDGDSSLLGRGFAVCSKRDAFCYRIGREIARGRALKALARSES